MTHQMCFFPKHKPDRATPLLITLQCLSVVYRTKFRCLSTTLEGLQCDPAFLPVSLPFIVPTEPKNQSHEIMFSWAFAQSMFRCPSSLILHLGNSDLPCKAHIKCHLLCEAPLDSCRKSELPVLPMHNRCSTCRAEH